LEGSHAHSGFEEVTDVKATIKFQVMSTPGHVFDERVKMAVERLLPMRSNAWSWMGR
jgi:hypothetical protein